MGNQEKEMNYLDRANQSNGQASMGAIGRVSADSPREVQQANDRLLREIEILEESLSALFQRLQPILLQNPESPSNCKEDQEYGCQMAIQLGAYGRRLSQNSKAVQRILSEIQV